MFNKLLLKKTLWCITFYDVMPVFSNEQHNWIDSLVGNGRDLALGHFTPVVHSQIKARAGRQIFHIFRLVSGELDPKTTRPVNYIKINWEDNEAADKTMPGMRPTTIRRTRDPSALMKLKVAALKFNWHLFDYKCPSETRDQLYGLRKCVPTHCSYFDSR